MDIRGNALGILMFVFAGAVAGVGSLILRLPDALVMVAVGLSVIGMDMAVRVRSRGTRGWLTRKSTGGYLFFIPAWGFGLVVIALNIVNLFWIKS